MSFVLSPEQRAGLLIAVISGGRPELHARPTQRFLAPLDAAGFPVIWVVSDHEAALYEPDGHPVVTYQREWAYEYAKTRWMLPTPPEPGGFLGAFPGREWACLEAERRGCWGVLQLDDNIVRFSFPRGAKAAFETFRYLGGLSWFADLLGAVTLATNGRMVGANLDAIASMKGLRVARSGFPYSVFVEQIGAGREEWYGPFEDDITHAFQYGTRADGATAVLMPLLRYMKESKNPTGMRAKYGHTRAVQLQRIFPESARINIRATRANGKGQPRVYHTMLPGAIRNRLTVHDPALFGQVKDRIEDGLLVFGEFSRRYTREKIRKRAGVAITPPTPEVATACSD